MNQSSLSVYIDVYMLSASGNMFNVSSSTNLCLLWGCKNCSRTRLTNQVQTKWYISWRTCFSTFSQQEHLIIKFKEIHLSVHLNNSTRDSCSEYPSKVKFAGTNGHCHAGKVCWSFKYCSIWQQN